MRFAFMNIQLPPTNVGMEALTIQIINMKAFYNSRKMRSVVRTLTVPAIFTVLIIAVILSCAGPLFSPKPSAPVETTPESNTNPTASYDSSRQEQSPGGNKYYIAPSGSDANPGVSPAMPRASVPWDIIVPGDSILFKCGGTYYGSLNVKKSGTAARPIIIGSYGTGAKPVFSGLITLTGWTKAGRNIWECDAAGLKNIVNILTINGIPYAVGRTPNNSYYSYESATPTTLTSRALSGAPSYVGAEIVMRKSVFVAERGTITAQSGNTVNYVDKTQPINNNKSQAFIAGKANNGFFIQRSASTLDQFGEWFYNPANQKLQLYSDKNPSTYTIKASNVDTVILLGNKKYITISNVAIEGGGLYGIESYGGSGITIKNCSFNNNTKAIYVWNTSDILIDNNTINNSFNGGVFVSNNQAKRINIINNTVTNTGQLIGMGVFSTEFNLRGIVARTDTSTVANYVNIIGNKVINTGNAAIQFQGSNAIIRRNIADSFCNQVDDNGGIYTFVSNNAVNTQVYKNRIVDSNFISNAIGAPQSANGNVDVVGLYFDDQTPNLIATHNTIWNIPGNGIQLNNAMNVVIADNLIFNCKYGLSVNKKQFGEVKGNIIKRNIFYADNDQYIMAYTNTGLDNSHSADITSELASFGDMDSNYYRMKKASGFKYYYAHSQGKSYTFPPDIDLAEWRRNTRHDMNSQIADGSKEAILKMNTSASNMTMDLPGGSWKDVQGNTYKGTVTMQPYTSKILFKP